MSDFQVTDPWIAVGSSADGVFPCTSIYKPMTSEQATALVGQMVGHLAHQSSIQNPAFGGDLDAIMSDIEKQARHCLDGLLAGDIGRSTP